MINAILYHSGGGVCYDVQPKRERVSRVVKLMLCNR